MNRKSANIKCVYFGSSTRFSNLAPLPAVLIITFLSALIAYSVFAFHAPEIDTNFNSSKGEDLRCYRAIISRIHAGEGYYTAAGIELRSRGYYTASFFNWRLPLLAWVLGHLPSPKIGQVFAVILASMTIIIWISVLQEHFSHGGIIFGGLLLAGPAVYSLLPDVFLMHEFWSGTLISLSLASYGRGWRHVSMISGLIALFLRELTLPFVCLMCVLSYIEGHKREAMLWIIGILAFCALLLYHAYTVTNLITGKDLVQKGGWIVFGGWPFVLSTAQVHPYLILAPSWVTAVILPFALLGLAGWSDRAGLRTFLTVVIFVSAYLFVGKYYNRYWGLMYLSVMPLGLLYAPACLRDLWLSAHRNRTKERD